jgi:glucose-1-phosphate adenylyltransferase
MGELTRHRPLSAIPFAGRYRVIDFMLSNIVNTGITSVGIMTYSKYRSLMDHIGTGSPWDLDRKNRQGLTMLPPYANAENTYPIYNSDNADLISVLDYSRSNRGKYLLVTDCTTLFTTTFDDMILRHEASGADITFMYSRAACRPDAYHLVVDTDRKNNLRNIYVKPEKPVTNKISMGVLVLNKALFEDLISESISKGDHGLSIHGLLLLHQHLQVKGYEFKEFTQHINSVQAYFSNTMQLLDASDARNALFWSGRPVYTKVKDEAPTLYSAGSHATGSIISDGCRILGEVRRSMLFRGVMVSRNAHLKNCIVMQDSYISENCELENIIIDKNCVIRPGIKLVGSNEYPIVIGKGTVL